MLTKQMLEALVIVCILVLCIVCSTCDFIGLFRNKLSTTLVNVLHRLDHTIESTPDKVSTKTEYDKPCEYRIYCMLVILDVAVQLINWQLSAQFTVQENKPCRVNVQELLTLQLREQILLPRTSCHIKPEGGRR